MDVIEAIHGRRTVHQFRPDPIPRDLIERCLEAATWAPNHKLTNPWEFYVVSGAAKEQLARLRGELKRQGNADPASEQAQKWYDRAYGEFLTLPYVVLVCQRLEGDEVRRWEDQLTVACAIQNFMLAAHGLGLGTFWMTGALPGHPETQRLLGVPEGRKAIGMIKVGWPAEQPKAPPRRPAPEVTHWIE